MISEGSSILEDTIASMALVIIGADTGRVPVWGTVVTTAGDRTMGVTVLPIVVIGAWAVAYAVQGVRMASVDP